MSTNVTNEQLKKLRSHTKNQMIPDYLTDDDTDSDNSDDELILKFTKPNTKTSKTECDFTSLAFTQSHKIGKLKTELGKTEERLRYLQLEYNNKNVDYDELELKFSKFRDALKDSRISLINSQNETKNLKRQRTVLIFSFFIYFINTYIHFIY